LNVIISRFKECTSYKNEIIFYFVDGINTTLSDIDNAVKSNMPETNIPFGDTDTYIPYTKRNINYHLQRIIYFINHPNEIRNIKIKSAWWIDNNVLYAYPHLKIEDGYHRIAAAFYLGLKKINMINYDYIRLDVKKYITGETNEKPKNKIQEIKLT